MTVRSHSATSNILRVVVWIGISTLIVALVIGVVQVRVLVGLIRDGQQDRAPMLESTHQAADESAKAAKSAAKGTRLIESCLRHTGRCGKESRQQADQFSRSFVASTVCAARLVPKYPDLGTRALIDKVTVCAVARLARQGKGTS